MPLCGDAVVCGDHERYEHHETRLEFLTVTLKSGWKTQTLVERLKAMFVLFFVGYSLHVAGRARNSVGEKWKRSQEPFL